MNSSKLSAFCDRVLEAGWLLGVTITPVFFNVYSSRVFEPDKLTTMRALATVMAVFWLVRFLEEAIQRQKPLRFSCRTPLVLPALVTMGVYLITSIFSLVPYTSFVGSYQRLQGTYSLFGYLVIFFALLTSGFQHGQRHLRRGLPHHDRPAHGGADRGEFQGHHAAGEVAHE
jgi:Na+-translocating ferredoxin:NAD+ oxidoreductase RnfA subunit